VARQSEYTRFYGGTVLELRGLTVEKKAVVGWDGSGILSNAHPNCFLFYIDAFFCYVNFLGFTYNNVEVISYG